MLGRAINVFSSGTAPDLIPSSFLPVKWLDGIPPIHQISQNSASNSPVNVIVQVMLFVQLSNLHMGVYIGVAGNLALRLSARSSFIYRFLKGMFWNDTWFPSDLVDVGIILKLSKLSELWLYFRVTPAPRSILKVIKKGAKGHHYSKFRTVS